MSRLRKLLCCLLACLFLPSLALAEEAEAAAGFAPPEGYALCAESAEWSLYLCERNLGLIVVNKASGKAMYSCVTEPDKYPGNEQWKALYTSGIVMDYLKGTVIEPLRADFQYMQSEREFAYFDGGFTCKAYFPEIKCGFTVTVTLEDNGVSVSIPLEGLVQDDEENFAISSFYVYPFMGYSYMGENGGYIFIPDGQGAIINLQDNENRYSSPFTATVYSQNIGLAPLTTGAVYMNTSTGNPAERIMMPVFGIAHEDDRLAYVSVIESGDDNAIIEANFNGVSNLPFDWAFAKYTYRVVYSQQTGPSSGTVNKRLPHINNFDIKQHFFFLEGDSANYCGMAKQYGKYLDSRGVFEHIEKMSDFGIQVDMFGTENENGMLGTQPVVMTSADNMAEILKDLKARGADNVMSVILGWMNNGYTGGLPLTSYSPSGAIGGAAGLERVFSAARETGAEVYLDTDSFTMTFDTAGMLKYSALKKVDSSTYTMPLYAWVYNSAGYLNPVKLMEYSASLSREYVSRGVSGASLSGFPQVLTAYYLGDKYHDKSECREYFERSASLYSEKLPTVISSPSAYLWRYARALAGVPAAGSDYAYTDAEVPFLSIALSGRIPVYTEYVNFQANTRRFFLKLVEQGTRPAFLVTWEDPIELSETNANWIYSSKYELYSEMIASWYSELKTLHDMIDASAIASHSVSGAVTTVTYDNGLTIYLNYGDKPAEAGGFTLEALSYKAVTANEP
ncbi:MAG: DUF5696 domain-containing protein [Eubacteriales bacterium]|nr:DUF5696 domain-containing protein [Eubacteriales bacterium]MDD3880993.1 DUF5696 domain-containing protein [Eubacteriales bacterium]MDD4511938.1 DUF5696 domain-containing protein [Eubacteriales bacterium]